VLLDRDDRSFHDFTGTLNMLTQTLAIFLDAYRELNARKLFWATLILSGLVVLLFSLIGINERGLRIGVWDIEMRELNTLVMSSETFYKSMFVSLGVGFWLSWIAAILAIVSTASIFPDFVSGGAIDLALSKPIGRLRLFLTKYVAGLLFVTLQVSVFSTTSFFLIGIMGGAWEPALFLAIPIVVLFFSYLYSVCVLLGIVTRSTIAALMLTLLFWFAIFLVHSAESTILTFTVLNEKQAEAFSFQSNRIDETLDKLRSNPEADETQLKSKESEQSQLKERIQSNEKTLGYLGTAHSISLAVKTVLPKTNETVGLLSRWLIDLAELPEVEESETPQDPFSGRPAPGLEREIEERIRQRSIAWIVGTSILFEIVTLSMAAWIFVRRDF